MSIEIDWSKLTTGPDGLELAETIRAFINEKFQQVALPRFIRSVEIHSFEFGDQAPTVELKDVCDPIPDFYENDGESDSDEEEEKQDVAIGVAGGEPRGSLRERREIAANLPHIPTSMRPQLPRHQSGLSLVDQIASPILSRSGTPGIPGGTSNLSYFHLPLSARLQGTQTPFGGFTGHASHLSQHTGLYSPQLRSPQLGALQQQQAPHAPPLPDEYHDPSTRPSTARSPEPSDVDGASENASEARPEPEPNDIQIVLHVSYDGNVRLSLTAEMLLDYPMASFVGIPLKLNVTGLAFDGIALLAYLKKKAHFCFLGQQDAEVLVGAQNALEGDAKPRDPSDKIGGLLREIRVETEIGQKDGGKQVLKNVGKVEKFVLEQVRRIFEDEFVYPSFWTFLV
ncbi:Mitochondrial distribution and morphology protein 12 [Thelotrema lepadinum]|nr:Mitochondrial distribution and morphology protein 12 [Thelotrema lepadinum]